MNILLRCKIICHLKAGKGRYLSMLQVIWNSPPVVVELDMEHRYGYGYSICRDIDFISSYHIKARNPIAVAMVTD
jgi:hypothetical protein